VQRSDFRHLLTSGGVAAGMSLRLLKLSWRRCPP
jgi:hypothetical protein